MTPLQRGRQAAAYFQRFVRARHKDYAELMINIHPNQGYGQSDNAYLAYDIAISMYHHTDEHFLNCLIPDNYGSPTHFKEKIEAFDRMLAEAEVKLKTAIDNQNSSPVPETVFMVLEQLLTCRHAIIETLNQLSPPTPLLHTTHKDTFEVLEMIARRFPSVVRRLFARRAERFPLAIKDEYDVQYLFQAILALYFDDIRPEECVPSVGGGSGRADTLLLPQKTLIEFKMTRAGSKDTQLRKELADDFILYAGHPAGKELFVFVYDPDKHIENPSGFQADMSKPRPPIERVQTFVQQN